MFIIEFYFHGRFRESKLVTPLVPGSSDNESQPASVQEVKGVKPFGSNEQKPSEQAAALQESWMVADDDLDSVTMSLQELEPPVSQFLLCLAESSALLLLFFLLSPSGSLDN